MNVGYFFSILGGVCLGSGGEGDRWDLGGEAKRKIRIGYIVGNKSVVSGGRENLGAMGERTDILYRGSFQGWWGTRWGEEKNRYVIEVFYCTCTCTSGEW